MSTRDLIKMDIDEMPDEMLEVVREFVVFLKRYNVDTEKKNSELHDNKVERGYQTLLKYKGTLKRDVDIKKERLEALDEKYNRFS